MALYVVRSGLSYRFFVPLVHVKDGKVFANSRDVADFFGKRHDNVLRDILALLKSGVVQRPNPNLSKSGVIDCWFFHDQEGIPRGPGQPRC